MQQLLLCLQQTDWAIREYYWVLMPSCNLTRFVMNSQS